MTIYAPKHRKNAVVKMRPIVQLAGRHEGTATEPRNERGLAAVRIPQWNDTEFRELLREVTADNPFRPNGVGRHAR